MQYVRLQVPKEDVLWFQMDFLASQEREVQGFTAVLYMDS